MILFEGIFSLSFCLVRQPSLNFTVSSSTDKGSEVTFFFIGRLAYCQICLLVSRLCNAEAWIKWQESSCYFTNVTFQLSARSDTLETCTAHALGLCFVFGICSFIVVTSRGDLMVGTLSFCFPPRGILVEDVFSTLYLMIYWTLTYISLIFCWQTSSGPKKKKKKEKWDVCPWMKCTWKKAGVNTYTKFYLMWNPQAPSHFPDNTQPFAIKLHTRSAGLWMPGLMVFLFYLAKDASTFTKSESDCSGMQRTGTERHQGSFRFYLFSGDLKQEVLPYLSFLLHQIAPLLLPCRSFFSARHFQEKLDSWCFRAWYSSQKNGTIIYFV